MKIHEVRPGTFFIQGRHVNWTILLEGSSATLIDSGYPADYSDLLESCARVGTSPTSIVAGIATHGHSDHIGGFAALRRDGHNFPIYAHRSELPNVRRDVVEQVTVRQAGCNLLKPRVAAWAFSAIRAGGLSDVAITDPVALPVDRVLDVPGSPTALLAPGHTSGHVALRLPGGVLLTGDALVTGHPTLPRATSAAPEVLPAYFHRDAAMNDQSAKALVSAGRDLILPGHGAPSSSRSLTLV